MGEVNAAEHVIFDRRVEPGTIKRLRKDGGKVRVHCGPCLANAVSKQVEEAMHERYQSIQDMPPCLYDRRTKDLVRLGNSKEEYHAVMVRITHELLVDLDLHWLASIETKVADMGTAMATFVRISVPNGPAGDDQDAPSPRPPHTCN